MSAAMLLPVLLVSWFLFFMAALSAKTLNEARRGVPEAERYGMSIFPIIPLAPLAAWGLALVADLIVDPWGTRVVGSLHAAGAVASSVSLVANIWRLRRITKQKNDRVGRCRSPSDS